MITDTTEKRFEMDIADSLLSAGGYTSNQDVYDPKLGLFPATLVRFVQKTQPKAWARFEMQNKADPERKFCVAFNNACDTDGLLHVLRHGFKHRGVSFHVCYFRPESSLNQTAATLYAANEITCNRQWFYSADTHNSVDMVLAVNGIPVFAFELKNQYTGQTVDNAKRQWMYDRDPREVCFQFNKRILGFFCVDQLEVWMTTKLAGKDTFFLPFNQGSNGAGRDGGKGNPANPDGYPTAYLWEDVFQKDSMMDILQKFIHLQIKKEKKTLPDGSEQTVIKKSIIFPRFHQLDVVRKILADVRAYGAGHNYLIQHSAGSGKSNSIAWTAYRLASLHDDENRPVFSSVIVVTDRTVLDAQLQETISGFDHTLGAVETIGENKTSKDLRDAINSGIRIIVTTLQKFPVIYQEVDKVAGKPLLLHLSNIVVEVERLQDCLVTGLSGSILFREVLQDIAHTETVAAHLVGIGGADALARRTHLVLALLGLVGSIEHTMRRHNQVCFLRNMQSALQLVSALLQRFGLVHKQVGSQHHAVADNVHLATLEDA